MSDGLTAKQAAFVREYVTDHNATRAAIRAGYSEKTAYSIGSENLSKPEIHGAIAEEEAKVADRLGITRHFVYSGFLTVFRTAMSLDKPDLAQANRSLESLGRLIGESAGFEMTVMDALRKATASDVQQLIRELEGELGIDRAGDSELMDRL